MTSPQKKPHLFDKIKRSSSTAWKILIFYCIVGLFSCAKANVALFYMSRELRNVAFVAAISPSQLSCSGGSRLCSTVLCQSLLFGFFFSKRAIMEISDNQSRSSTESLCSDVQRTSANFHMQEQKVICHKHIFAHAETGSP